MRYGYNDRSANRFSNYSEISARFDSTATCGHEIKKGETIGYNRRHGTRCASCWSRWSSENAEAQAYEDRYSYCADSNY